jgi:proline iminopeptidase
MQILFPELKPYQRHQVKVTDKHELYVDEAGNVDGIPILFVHGGPVELVGASSRRFYDHAVYRIITSD